MASIQVYANEFGEVRCDQQKGLVHVYWPRHCGGEPFRNLLSEALCHAASSHLTVWLCDLRKLYYMEMADQHWLLNKFFASFDPNHRHRIAFLIGISNFEMMLSSRTPKIIETRPELLSLLEIDYFYTAEEALDWLHLPM